MRDLTMEDAARALREAFDADAEIRVDMKTVRPATRLAPPTPTEAISAVDEAAEYSEFAALLGLGADDPSPTTYVTVSQEQHQEWLDQTKLLDALMRERPADVTPEEQAEYETFAKAFGF